MNFSRTVATYRDLITQGGSDIVTTAPETGAVAFRTVLLPDGNLLAQVDIGIASPALAREHLAAVRCRISSVAELRRCIGLSLSGIRMIAAFWLASALGRSVWDAASVHIPWLIVEICLCLAGMLVRQLLRALVARWASRAFGGKDDSRVGQAGSR